MYPNRARNRSLSVCAIFSFLMAPSNVGRTLKGRRARAIYPRIRVPISIDLAVRALRGPPKNRRFSRYVEVIMNELTALASSLGSLLKERKETIAVAESSAGGLISAALLAVPGASAYFLGGGVIYTQAARRGLLRVPDDAVKNMRSSTEPYAQLKARTVRELLGATWGLAETGASGPTGNRYGDAAGHACIAVAGPVERALTLETRHGDREKNMWTFARAALELLETSLRKE